MDTNQYQDLWVSIDMPTVLEQSLIDRGEIRDLRKVMPSVSITIHKKRLAFSEDLTRDQRIEFLFPETIHSFDFNEHWVLLNYHDQTQDALTKLVKILNKWRTDRSNWTFIIGSYNKAIWTRTLSSIFD